MEPHDKTADPWDQLAALREAARDGGDAKTTFAAAMRDFHAAGWGYRMIGRAAGVSHEHARHAIRDLAPGTPPSGIAVPVRQRNPEVIPVRDMDSDIAADLRARLDAAVTADPGNRTGTGLRRGVADYFAALNRALDAGWDAYSIAAALGSHPAAVYKFARHHSRHPDGSAAALPPAPHRDEPAPYRGRRPALSEIRIPDDDVTALQALEARGYGASASTEAQEAHLALLGRWYLHGAARKELERATGQHWETVRKRLVRAGFMAGHTSP